MKQRKKHTQSRSPMWVALMIRRMVREGLDFVLLPSERKYEQIPHKLDDNNVPVPRLLIHSEMSYPQVTYLVDQALHRMDAWKDEGANYLDPDKSCKNPSSKKTRQLVNLLRRKHLG